MASQQQQGREVVRCCRKVKMVSENWCKLLLPLRSYTPGNKNNKIVIQIERLWYFVSSLRYGVGTTEPHRSQRRQEIQGQQMYVLALLAPPTSKNNLGELNGCAYKFRHP